MISSIRSVATALFIAALALGPCGIASADSESGKKRDSKPATPVTLTVDASKLPPEVLRELLKYAGGSKSTAAKPEAAGKGKPA